MSFSWIDTRRSCVYPGVINHQGLNSSQPEEEVMTENQNSQKTYTKLPEALCAKEGIIVPVYLDKEAYDLVIGCGGHPFCIKLNRKSVAQEHDMISWMLEEIVKSFPVAPADPRTHNISGKFEFEGFMQLDRFIWNVSVENDEPVMRVDHVREQ